MVCWKGDREGKGREEKERKCGEEVWRRPDPWYPNFGLTASPMGHNHQPLAILVLKNAFEKMILNSGFEKLI